jgi:hypothetical protein
MHYEQRWLDLAPALFDGVEILRDSAYNVGHWNLPERRITVLDGAVLVDAKPCRLFRFSGYDPEAPEWITSHSRRLTAAGVGDARVVFERFRSALLEEGFLDTHTWPYAYGAFDDGVPVPEIARNLYLAMSDKERFGDPLRTKGSDSYVRWLNQGIDGSEPGPTTVTRLWHAIYASRPDLQRAFPDLLHGDREQFLAWTVHTGAAEHRIHRHFLPHVEA